MLTWLIALIVLLLVVAGMAIGVMAGRKPIAGSCGGLAGKLGIDHACTCGKTSGACTGESSAPTDAQA